MRCLILAVLLVSASLAARAQTVQNPADALEACLKIATSAGQQDQTAVEQFCLTMYEGDVELKASEERLARTRQEVFDKFVATGLTPETARMILRADSVRQLRALPPADPNDSGARFRRAIERNQLVRQLAAIDALMPTPQSSASRPTTPETRVVQQPIPVFIPPLPLFELPQIQPYIMEPPRPSLNVTCTSYRFGVMVETRCQ